MDIYLVGGYLRDQLLGRDSHDKDYLVVNATAADLIAKGFTQVGIDFPVFLHPETKEEYALARTERKVSKGYQGFTFNTENVTLEDDLKRRDLTINAMAKDINTGEVKDPYHGQLDLDKRLLKHVSATFTEDPLRVLRVARFMAQLADYHFSIAPETITLMKSMVQRGDLTELSAERVFIELKKALQSSKPSLFFTTLKALDALSIHFSELDKLFAIKEGTDNLGEKTMRALDVAAALKLKDELKFASLCIHFKSLLTKAADTSSQKNELKDLIHTFSNRIKTPKQWEKYAFTFCATTARLNQVFELSAADMLTLLQDLSAEKSPDFFNDILDLYQAQTHSNQEVSETVINYLKPFPIALKHLNPKDIIQDHMHGEAIKEAIQQQKIIIIDELIAKEKP